MRKYGAWGTRLEQKIQGGAERRAGLKARPYDGNCRVKNPMRKSGAWGTRPGPKIQGGAENRAGLKARPYDGNFNTELPQV